MNPTRQVLLAAATMLVFGWRGAFADDSALRSPRADSASLAQRRQSLESLAFQSKAVLRRAEPGSPDRAEAEQAVDSLFDVATDRTAPALLRADAAAEVAALVQIQREQGALTDSQRRRFGAGFMALLRDETEDEHVRGRAVKALRALDEREAIPMMRSLIGAGGCESVFLRRCAIVALAKMGEQQAVDDIVARAAMTDDPDEFATILYSAGLFRDPSMLRTLLANAGRFDPQISRNLLWYNRDVVSAALGSSDRALREDGIEAVVRADLRPLKPALVEMLRDPELIVRRRAMSALLAMGCEEESAAMLDAVQGDADPVIAAGAAEILRRHGPGGEP